MSEHFDRLTLEAYAEELASAAQRQAVEAHIAECQGCRARLASARQMSALLRRLPREMPAPYLAAQINATIAARRTPAIARWTRVLVPAMFVIGLALVMSLAPRWGGWAQIAGSELPTSEAMTTWLINVVIDPAMALESLILSAESILAGTAELDVALTMATVLLALASVAWLAQLLGADRQTIARA
jgi:predicted anti-sigma-YlaC factor YlaD